MGPRVKIEVGIPLTIDVIDVSNLMSLYPKGLLVHTVQCSAVADLSESLSCLNSLVRHVLQVHTTIFDEFFFWFDLNFYLYLMV